MALTINGVRDKIQESAQKRKENAKDRREKRESGEETRASRTTYVVRQPGKIHYVGLDEGEAKEFAASLKDADGKPLKVETFGSYRSLPASVIVGTWKSLGDAPNLADYNRRLGQRWGTSDSQNESRAESLAKTLISANDLVSKAAPDLAAKLPDALEMGEWETEKPESANNGKELSQAEIDALKALAG